MKDCLFCKIAAGEIPSTKVYEDELDERVAALSTMIEPILMVALALVAGGIVGAVLMPIYQLVGDMGV